jgi:hypothetical protein
VDGVRAHTPALEPRGEQDVDVGAPVIGVGLLPELDQADDLALVLDREQLEVVGVVRPLGRLRVPPALDLGLGADRPQRLAVVRRDRPQAHPLTVEPCHRRIFPVEFDGRRSG